GPLDTIEIERAELGSVPVQGVDGAHRMRVRRRMPAPPEIPSFASLPGFLAFFCIFQHKRPKSRMTAAPDLLKMRKRVYGGPYPTAKDSSRWAHGGYSACTGTWHGREARGRVFAARCAPNLRRWKIAWRPRRRCRR